jgi:aspartate aminotransferase
LYSKAVKEALERSSWIRKMFEEGAKLKREFGHENVFDFSIGNPLGDPPPQFYRTLMELLSRPEPGMHSYMQNAGYPEVREGKARELKHLTGRKFEGDNIVMTAGAAGGLNVVLKALLNPGEKVICFSPYFVEYLFYISNHGGVPIVLETGEDFEPELDNLAKNLSEDVKAVIINTPNNPTGRVYRRDTLERMGEIFENHEQRTGNAVYTISDEPYREIVYGDVPFCPPAKHIRNCIVVYSHSKDLNIPGERIGYAAISPDATLGDEIFDAMVFANRTLGFVNAPALMQRISGAIQNEKPDLSVYRENRVILARIFTELGVDFHLPEGAFYFFPRIPDGVSEADFTDGAWENRILIVPGGGFGREGFFRVAYCTSTNVVKRSEEAWRRFLSQVRKP